MSEYIAAIKKAVKRAKFFTKDFKYEDPLSPVSKSGLAIPIRNYTWLSDIQNSSKVELINIYYMSEAVNNYIDHHLIEGDIETITSLASFLSRIWFDPNKLE